jgi:hypothetical protein
MRHAAITTNKLTQFLTSHGAVLSISIQSYLQG